MAVTCAAWVIGTIHVPVPLHPSPLQPVKLEPLAAAGRQRHALVKGESTARAATVNPRGATRHRATARPCLAHRQRERLE